MIIFYHGQCKNKRSLGKESKKVIVTDCDSSKDENSPYQQVYLAYKQYVIKISKI